MTKIYILLMCILFSFASYSQEKICIGEKHSIYSKKLNENREYWVYLPPQYNDDNYGKARYPVIYLLDGDKNFLSLAAIQQMYTKGMYNSMPECIIVGILNTDRTRDFTPSQSYMMHKGKKMFENSGGSESFYKFIEEELKPQIESDYRTDGYNMIVGHSFGGLFVLNTLIHHTEAFNAYIAIDPSIWWDNDKIYKEALDVWTKKDFEGRTLFIAMAKKESEEGSKADNPMHSPAIQEFCSQILPMQPSKINASWKYYGDEDHGSVIMPSLLDAFRNIFSGIQLPVKEVPYQPELIELHYKVIADRLKFRFTPDEILIDNIGNYAISTGNIANARKILEYNYKNFPDSKNAKKSLDKVNSLDK